MSTVILSRDEIIISRTIIISLFSIVNKLQKVGEERLSLNLVEVGQITCVLGALKSDCLTYFLLNRVMWRGRPQLGKFGKKQCHGTTQRCPRDEVLKVIP